MNTLLQDLKYGFRMLARSPGVTAVAALSLALGIGANTAIFSLVNAVLLRPLPYQDPDQLVFISEHSEQVPDMSVSYLNFLDWQRQNTAFDDVGAFQPNNFTLTGNELPERVSGWNVSGNFFRTLGVKPILGRDFLPEEDKPGGARVVLMTYGLWQRRFGGDRTVVGKSLAVNGRAYNVAGILPRAFKFAADADLYAALGIDADGMKQRGDHPGIYVVARRKRGVAFEQARAQMLTLAARLAEQYPDTNKGNSVVVKALREELVEVVRPAILVLLGAVGLVLLIACANVANLLLVRATTREKEMSIRAALGASRLRMVRQLLTESLVLSALGGGSGLLLGYWGIGGLGSLIPDDFRNLIVIDIDRSVLAFTMGVSLLTALIFGFFPALQASRSNPSEALKEGGRGSGSGSSRRLRGVLAAAEVAVSVVLLIGAGLMLRSIHSLLAVDPGFVINNVLTMRVSLPDSKYPKPIDAGRFFHQVLQRVRTLPGVVSASVVTPLPLTGQGWQQDFYLEGRPVPAPGQFPNSDYHTVDPDYPRAMGIPLLGGRYLVESDDEKAPRAALINRAMARRYWPGEEPLGKRFRVGGNGPEGFSVTVVGIVGDTKQYGLDKPSKTEFYISYLQYPMHYMTLVVRTASSPSALAPAVRYEVQAVDKDQPVYDIRTMDEWLSVTAAPRRLTMMLLAAFAALALFLAAVGIYGVMSYTVSQRTREIGIRMALGAGGGEVLKLIVGQGVYVALIGAAAGLAGAWGATRLMSTLLFGVRATDPLTFGAVALLLGAVALAASYVPARRATKVDPMVALRYE